MDTTEIELAMDELLRSALDARGRGAKDKFRPAIINAAEVKGLALSPIGDLIESPTFAACRRGIRAIGEYLASQGQTMDDLRALLHRVAALDGQLESRRIDIIDKAWGGMKLPSGGIWLS